MNPKVTIGLTFYNGALTLKDALSSIFAQTFQDWELVIVDDNSTDGSLEIVQSVKDPRVYVYRSEWRGGFVKCLNRTIGMAKGKYYARMDADDMMHPERLSKQIDYLEENKDVDLVDTGMYSMDQHANLKGVRNLNSIDYSPVNLLSRGLLCHATVLGHVEWFRRNTYDQKYLRAEDRELWCRTFEKSCFGRIKEPLYFVREGRVNVDNCLMSGKTERLIIKTYGPHLLGKRGPLKLITTSYMKSLAYEVFGVFGIHEILVNMRNKKLRNQDKLYASNIIEKILSTQVPGL